MTKTKPGKYYGVTDRRQYVELDADEVDRPPDKVICRRAADYPFGGIPGTAGFTDCTRCGASIVYNPAGPHQTVPKICMQCASITPLPFNGPA